MFVLAACGGGGGGGGGADPAPAPANPPPANQAPSVSAGADQTITLPANSVQLQGSATDDGLTANLTYAWSASGSGVSFTDAASASTTATFAAEGTYDLTLTVGDGSLSGSDSLQVVVNPAPAPGNQAPTVEAGADQTIELPFTATLSGSATDDGPASALSYSWSATPDGVTFANAAAAQTDASFAAAGTYTLTLTVSDGTDSGTDSLAVTVDPAVYPAADDDSQADRGWLRVAAAEVGMDQALLDQAATYASSSPAGAGAGIIVRRGRLVHSWGEIDERFDLKSTTKSIGGMALGLALDESRLALSDQAIVHLPNLGNPPVANVATGWLPEITVLQLATHTAGFEKTGGYGNLINRPGTTWFYSDGGLNWLADLLTELYDQDLSALMTARVWNVLGVNTDDVRWRAMMHGLRPDPRPSGIEHRELASGIIANVNAMARVGLLFLRRGVWADQRVLSESFVDVVQTPRPEIASAANPSSADFPGATSDYGVLWWTNESGQMANVPRATYWAWGLGESLIIVIPSLDLVIARAGPQSFDASAGRVWNDSEWNGDYSVLVPFLEPIVQSVTP